MSRVRLDLLLTGRGLAPSREKAQALIMAGAVTAEGVQIVKAGQLVDPGVHVEVRQPEPYVSRGGYKLAHALDLFSLSVDGKIAVDVGASTGGFTDVLLQRNAARVYAVDVGRGQLHARLREDPRVVVFDRTNARYLQSLPEKPQLATIDVSFISLRLVVPSIHRLLEPGSTMIVLVKPQFEAGRKEVGRGGVVRSETVHRHVLQDLVSTFSEQGLKLHGLTASPVRGPAGNAEYLAWLWTEPPPSTPAELIETALREVHAAEPVKGPLT